MSLSAVRIGLYRQPRSIHKKGVMFYQTMSLESVPAGTKELLLCSRSDGTGDIRVDDQLQVTFEAENTNKASVTLDFSNACQGGVAKIKPVDLLALTGAGQTFPDVHFGEDSLPPGNRSPLAHDEDSPFTHAHETPFAHGHALPVHQPQGYSPLCKVTKFRGSFSDFIGLQEDQITVTATFHDICGALVHCTEIWLVAK